MCARVGRAPQMGRRRRGNAGRGSIDRSWWQMCRMEVFRQVSDRGAVISVMSGLESCAVHMKVGGDGGLSTGSAWAVRRAAAAVLGSAQPAASGQGASGRAGLRSLAGEVGEAEGGGDKDVLARRRVAHSGLAAANGLIAHHIRHHRQVADHFLDLEPRPGQGVFAQGKGRCGGSSVRW